MFKAMKEYWNEVFKPSCRWLKKHWKGYLVFSIIVYAVTLGPYLYEWYKAEKEPKQSINNDLEESKERVSL